MQIVNVDEPIRLKTKHGHFRARYLEEPLQRRAGVALYGEYSQIDSPVLLRVQSSCLFSESFWTTDCDCALQLQESLRQVSERPGIVVYFYEEGRGSGLQLKMQAIRLQQLENLNTAQAFNCLGAEVDPRQVYSCLPDVIQKVFGRKVPVILLSNSPKKIDLIRKSGVDVTEIRALICGADNPEIRRYLDEKKKALNHNIFFPDQVSDNSI
jgi:GTP cyclohydrolase II